MQPTLDIVYLTPRISFQAFMPCFVVCKILRYILKDMNWIIMLGNSAIPIVEASTKLSIPMFLFQLFRRQWEMWSMSHSQCNKIKNILFLPIYGFQEAHFSTIKSMSKRKEESIKAYRTKRIRSITWHGDMGICCCKVLARRRDVWFADIVGTTTQAAVLVGERVKSG